MKKDLFLPQKTKEKLFSSFLKKYWIFQWDIFGKIQFQFQLKNVNFEEQSNSSLIKQWDDAALQSNFQPGKLEMQKWGQHPVFTFENRR